MPLLSAMTLKRALEEDGHLLADGAMGSLLCKEGLVPNTILPANRTVPFKVAGVHQRYLEAGSRIITANTFGWRDDENISEYVREGALIAEQAVELSPYMGSVWLALTSAFLRLEVEILQPIFAGRAVIIETCTSLKHAELALIRAKEATPVLIGVTCHFRANGKMPDGSEPEEVVRTLEACGADIVGANCGDNPESFVGIAKKMKGATGLPLLIQPSAGLPRDNTLGEWDYPVTIPEFVASISRLIDMGVKIVGGCCGTTPDYIRAVHRHCFIGGD